MTILSTLGSKLPDDLRMQVRLQAEIADLLVHILQKRGIRKSELAELTGLQKSQISKIVAGHGNLTLGTIARLQVALGEDLILIPQISTGAEAFTTPRGGGEGTRRGGGAGRGSRQEASPRARR